MSDRQGTAKIWYLQIYTRWRYFSRKPCFFVLFHKKLILGRLSTLSCLPFTPGVRSQNGVIAYCLSLTMPTDDWMRLLWGWKLPSLYIFQTPSQFFLRNPRIILLSLVYHKTQLHILLWNPQTKQLVKGQHVTFLIVLFFKMFSQHFL